LVSGLVNIQNQILDALTNVVHHFDMSEEYFLAAVAELHCVCFVVVVAADEVVEEVVDAEDLVHGQNY